MTKKIIIIGGVGNGSVIADAIADAATRYHHPELEVTGFLNDRTIKSDTICGYPVLGTLNDLRKYIDRGYYFIYTINRIDGQAERIALFESLQIPAEQMLTFVHPSAYVAPSAQIGPGSIIMPLCAVSAEAQIGNNCLIMPGSTVGHNTLLTGHCHLAAQSCISSFVKLNTGVHIGLNATVGDNLEIGELSTLGMGSVLTANMPAGQVWVGNPARYLRDAQ